LSSPFSVNNSRSRSKAKIIRSSRDHLLVAVETFHGVESNLSNNEPLSNRCTGMWTPEMSSRRSQLRQRVHGLTSLVDGPHNSHHRIGGRADTAESAGTQFAKT